MAILMRHTSPTLGDVYVHDDDTVTNVSDGTPNTSAIVSHHIEKGVDVIRVDLNGNGMLDINAEPQLMRAKVIREPGWQGAIGYRVLLEDHSKELPPNALALAVYANPDGMNYLYTTGGFIWMEEYQKYGAVCPPGFEPGQANIYFGMLYGATAYSTFTMHSEWDIKTFSCGGDI